MVPDPPAPADAEPPELPANALVRWWNECPWQRRIIKTILTLAILAGGYWGARQGMAELHRRQVDRHMENAIAAAAAQDWASARNSARSVLVARPDEFEAFRIWQRALHHTDDPRSYMAAITLFYDPRASREDRLESFRALAEQAPQALSLGCYMQFSDEERNDPEVTAALAEILLLRGQFQMLEEVLRQQPSLDGHPRAQLAMLRTLCATEPDPAKHAEARQILLKLIKSGASKEALAGIEALAGVAGGLASAELAGLPEWIIQQPAATPWQRLLALEPRLATTTDDQEAIFQRAIDEFITSAPGSLGDWLVRHGRAARAIELLATPSAEDPQAYTALVHALLAAKRPAEAATRITTPPATIDPLEREFLEVDVARAQQDEPAEVRAWNRALQQAPLDNSRNRFIEVARHAEKVGNPRVAERAWTAAIKVGFGRLPLYRDIMPLVESLWKADRSADLLEIFRVLQRFEPQNLELHNNYLYLSLIHGITPPEIALQRFQAMASENPDMPALFSSAAMAALMAGQPQTALECLKGVSTTEHSAMMRFALLGTATLLAGDPDGARPLLAKVDWNRFLNQEAAVFRKLQLDSQVANLPLPELRIPPGDDNSVEWQRAQQRLDHPLEELPPLPPLELPKFKDPATSPGPGTPDSSAPR